MKRLIFERNGFFRRWWGKRESLSRIFSTFQKRYREILLTRVWDAWIDGVLNQSLYNEHRIELRLELHSELEHPLSKDWQSQNDSPQFIPADTKILDVFKESGNSLVFIGEPGSGKTTLLLELASQAIVRARTDPDQPAPIIFNLTTWAPEQSLDVWLIDEIERRYCISPMVSKTWVSRNKLIVLLDGLDEVKNENREQCVQAINAFTGVHAVPIAICCRSSELLGLETRLNVQGMVVIQPISTEKAVDYLKKADVSLISVYNKLNESADQESKSFLHTPLFISMLILAYRGAQVNEIRTFLRSDDYRQQLFEHYIEKMFMRQDLSQNWTKDQTQHWLGWLAKQMAKNGQTIFYIEDIQLSWLEKKRQKFQFRFLYGLLVFLSMMLLIFGMTAGWGSLHGDRLVAGLRIEQIFGLTVGLIFGLICGLITSDVEYHDPPHPTLHQSYRFVMVSLLFGVVMWLINFRDFGLVGGLASSLLIGLSIGFKDAGSFVLDHILYRFLLHRSNNIPFKLVTFLDLASQRVLLRKVGNGYIFIHRLVMEHFAQTDRQAEFG